MQIVSPLKPAIPSAHNASGIAKPTSAFSQTDLNSLNSKRNNPQFQGFRHLRKAGGLHNLIAGLILCIGGLLAASRVVPGLSGIVQEPPTTQNTLGTVKPNIGLALTITQNGFYRQGRQSL
jgi:hypothetical protein